MTFIEEFNQRGYFHQCTNLELLRNKTATEKIVAYVGFDCTASSLHVGNLMQVMILRLLQQYGHKPIILIGGGTTKIGDPTGKEEARKVLNDQDILSNAAGIKKSLAKFIKFGDGPSDAVMVNNADWLDQIKYLDFLRRFGSLFSINRMLTMDSVKSRLEREQSLTFLEFNYMLLQAYDFYHLHQEYNCALQLGGSDQWGNIVTGVELVRKIKQTEVMGLTTPLLTTASGAKMGKSLQGAVWLNEEALSPYEYFQYWRNTEDADVVKFAKLYGEFTTAESNEFEATATRDINEAKKQLAYRVTCLCHGQAAGQVALETSRQVFEKGAVSDNLPTVELAVKQIADGIFIYDLFFLAGLSNSKSEAKRLIRGGGARINNQAMQDENIVIDMQHVSDNIIKLSAGKKKHILIKLK